MTSVFLMIATSLSVIVSGVCTREALVLVPPTGWYTYSSPSCTMMEPSPEYCCLKSLVRYMATGTPRMKSGTTQRPCRTSERTMAPSFILGMPLA